MVTPSTSFRLAGNTTRFAFRGALLRTVGDAPNPDLADDADRVYDALAPHKLTRLGAAMAWIERRNDTDPGGLSYYPRFYHNLWAVKSNVNRDGWARYTSYEAAAVYWAPYVLGNTYADLTTIRQFINRYAPPFENDTEFYVRFLADEINRLPLLEEGGTTPMPPVIYDLYRDADAQRFGLTRAEASRILDNQYISRNGKRPEVIVYHVQDGYTPGSLDWWANGPGVQASSTNMVQQDGSILNIIPKSHGPWTNGDTNAPSARGRAMQRLYGNDLNPVSLTIEAEDAKTRTVNATQKETILWQVREWIKTWPHLADPARHLGHYDINSVSRPNCGLYRDSIVAALGAAPPPTPTPTPGIPAWLTEPHILAAFPDYSPAGIVSKALVRYIAKSGTLPIYKERLLIDADSSVFVFDRVTIIHEGSSAKYEGEV